SLGQPGRRPRAERRPNQQVDRTELFLFQAEGLSNAALDAVTYRGAGCVFARYEHAEARRPGMPRPEVEDESVQAAPHAVVQQALEFCLAPQAAPGAQS